MRNTRFTLLLFGAAFFIQSCQDTENPPPIEEPLCGEDLQWSGTLDMDADLSVSKVENGFRIFEFENLSEPVDMCTEEPSTAKYTVELKQDGGSTDMSFAANAYWSLVEKTEAIPYNNGSDLYYTEMELALKDAFQGNPGFVGLQIHVKFPTKGSLDADKAYLQANIAYMRIDLDYKKYKKE